MAIGTMLKGAFSGRKTKIQSENTTDKNSLKNYKLDRNQCYALLMTDINSAHELTKHDWFHSTIEQLVELGLVQAYKKDDDLNWRVTGLGENVANYLSKAGIRLTLSGK